MTYVHYSKSASNYEIPTSRGHTTRTSVLEHGRTFQSKTSDQGWQSVRPCREYTPVPIRPADLGIRILSRPIRDFKCRFLCGLVRSQPIIRLRWSSTDRDLCRVPEIYLTLTSEMGNRAT